VVLRIVRTRYKLLYLVVWFGGRYLLSLFAYPHLRWIVAIAIWLVVTVAPFVVAVRSFRGTREPVEPPRPLWRLTGGVTSGFVIAAGALLLSAFAVLEFLGVEPRELVRRPFDPTEIANALCCLVVAGLYLNSSIRLRREPAPPISPTVDPVGPRLDQPEPD